MPRPRSALPVVCALLLVAAACGGSVANTGGGPPGDDAGRGSDSGTPPSDAGLDANRGDAVTVDGGCITPTLGEACTADEEACQPGNPCCVGYEWACSPATDTWIQEGLGCSCQIDAGRPDASTEVPTNHRPDDSQCATVPAAGTCSEMFMNGMCSSDSDCTMGTNGRCIESNGGAIYCSCTYDTCATDTDCPAGQLCACHGSAYLYGNGNTCEPGNCRVDSDCGAGGYCSPSGGGGCGGLGGYYCHTPSDTCVNDSDCQGEGPDDCEWSATDARWECTMEELCG